MNKHAVGFALIFVGSLLIVGFFDKDQ